MKCYLVFQNKFSKFDSIFGNIVPNLVYGAQIKLAQCHLDYSSIIIYVNDGEKRSFVICLSLKMLVVQDR